MWSTCLILQLRMNSDAGPMFLKKRIQNFFRNARSCSSIAMDLPHSLFWNLSEVFFRNSSKNFYAFLPWFSPGSSLSNFSGVPPANHPKFHQGFLQSCFGDSSEILFFFFKIPPEILSNFLAGIPFELHRESHRIFFGGIPNWSIN